MYLEVKSTAMATVISAVMAEVNLVSNSRCIEIINEIEKIILTPFEMGNEDGKWSPNDCKFIKEVCDNMYSNITDTCINDIRAIRHNALTKNIKIDTALSDVLYDSVVTFNHYARSVHFRSMKRFNPGEFKDILDTGNLTCNEIYKYNIIKKEKKLIKHELEDKEEYHDVGNDAKYEAYRQYVDRLNILYKITDKYYSEIE